MKKNLLILAFVIGLSTVVNAQPRAVGIKLGWGTEAMYQHGFGSDFIETDLGLYTFDELDVAATYNFMIAQPKWSNRGEWGFYAGPGVAVGFDWDDSHINLAVAGQIGLEYTFWFPLRLSLDLGPQIGGFIGDIDDDSSHFYWGVVPMISASYRF